MELKIITIDDLPDVLILRNKNRHAFFDERYVLEDDHKKWFENLNYDFYVIWQDGERVGTISYRNGEIGNVLIDEFYRDRGIASRAIKMLVEHYKTMNKYQKFQVEVKPKLVPFYEKQGFKIKKIGMEK